MSTGNDGYQDVYGFEGCLPVELRKISSGLR